MKEEKQDPQETTKAANINPKTLSRTMTTPSKSTPSTQSQTPTKWNLYAHQERDQFLHVGTKNFVKAHGLDLPIVPVTVTITGEGKGPPVAYYGWQDIDEYDKPPSLIWPHWSQFHICFAYGPEAEVERGRGRIVQLQILTREPDPSNPESPP